MNVESAGLDPRRMLALKEAASARIERLQASGRTDEANLLKAGRNIYDMALALWAKQPDGAAFLAALSSLGEGWQAMRAQALAHGDYERVAVEDAKLEALQQIRSAACAPAGEVCE